MGTVCSSKDKKSIVQLDPSEISEKINERAQVIDVHPPSNSKLYKGALYFPPPILEAFIIHLISKDTNLIIVTETPASSLEIIKKLRKLGYKNIIGYLSKPSNDESISSNFITISRISAENFKSSYKAEDIVLDVRKPEEWAQGHFPKAKLISLANFNSEVDSFKEKIGEKNRKIFTHCKAGGRGMIAQSYLIRQGYTNVTSIDGGTTEMEKAGVDLSAK